MARTSSAGGTLFGDEEFAWEDAPAGSPAPDMSVPSPPALRPRPRPRRQTRTLAGDLARLRAAAGQGLAAIPLSVLVGVVAMLLGVLVAMVTLVPGRGPSEPEADVRAGAAPRQSAAVPSRASSASLTLPTVVGPGDRGGAVRGVQAALVALGLASLTPDADFGPGTGAAVAAFQREHALTADGIVGPATAIGLADALAERARAEAVTAEDGLAAAVAAGRLGAGAADRHQAVLAESLAALERLAVGQRAYVVLALHTLAAHAAVYDEPRALTLFAMLEANVRHLAKHALPMQPTDITGGDGIVYRFFPVHGFQFHPLANFARLNGLARKSRRDQAEKLAAGLVARGVPERNALVWEYYFPFGGPSRWTSALAQGTAAQALARSGALLDDPDLLAGAEQAYRALRAGLSRELGGGLWVREYSFGDIAILNAQLQVLVSLLEYVRITGNEDARAFAAELDEASQALLSEFDTGCWSRYSLGGQQASEHYHDYHVVLLKALAANTGDALWRETANRWDGYRRTPSAYGCR